MLWPLFPPSVRCGGPARTAEAILSTLSDDFEFSVVTSAFDGPTSVPMDGVTPDRWSDIFGAKAWYMSERRPPVARYYSSFVVRIRSSSASTVFGILGSPYFRSLRCGYYGYRFLCCSHHGVSYPLAHFESDPGESGS